MSDSVQPHGLYMEFSRQEYWSGLPFPSPGDLSNPGIKAGSPALQANYLHLSHQGSPNMKYSRQARILEWVAFPSSEDLPNPGIETKSPTLHADSLPAEPPGKPKNTGVGSLSLLQGIFLTQESNWGLLHCRWILYQLSYQGTSTCWDISKDAASQGFAELLTGPV